MSLINSFWKDIFREIRRTKTRFISLALITALGAIAIVGIHATVINMQNAADRMYKEQALYDLHLISTTGFTDEDIEAIQNTYGVSLVMASHSADVYAYISGEKRPVRTSSLPDTLNLITLIDGRLPERYDEIVIEQNFLGEGGFKFGDTITLSLDDAEEFESIFVTGEFTVVGTVSSPLFITFERGRTTLGAGLVRYFAYLHTEAYALEVFTDVYIAMEGSREIFNLSREYDELAEEWASKLQVTGEARIEVLNTEIKDARAELEDFRIELEYARIELKDARSELEYAMAQIEGLPEFIRTPLLEEIYIKWEKYYERREEYYERLEQFEAYYEELNAIPPPEWFYLTRKDGIAFDAYYQDTLRLRQLGYVFPVVFFLVAVLMALTSMSRMVEEHRTQIGTYRALGFGAFAITLKYGLYATFSGSLGGIVGVAIGSQVLPHIIAGAYANLYYMPPIETPVPWAISIFAIVVSVMSVLLITIFTCIRTMSGMPAELLRPKAPPPGKRVLAERIPFIWKNLGFIEKVTARNIFRYKKRFFMTLIGVAGCTALIVTAFGMRDSLNSVAHLQYAEILRYDAVIHIQETRYLEQRQELTRRIPAESSLYSRHEATTVQTDVGRISATLVVPEHAGLLSEFIRLKSPEGITMKIPEQGVLLTEKLARDLGISMGDTIELRMSNANIYEVFVYGIVENYVLHFVYMSRKYFTETFGATPYPNTLLVKGEIDNSEILRIGEVRAITIMADLKRTVSDSTDALGIVTILLLVLSCALALIVLINLAIINFEERRRELATLKVLGFTDRDILMYFSRENLSVTALAIILGLIGGNYLSGFVISSIEIEMIKFPREINSTSFIYAACISFVLALGVNFITNWKVTAINMVESLKSVE